MRGDKTWQDVMLRGTEGVRVLPVARAIQNLPKLDEANAGLLESLIAAATDMDVVLIDAARDGHSVCASLSGDEPLLLVLNADRQWHHRKLCLAQANGNA